jgi:hypothetical protein
LALGDPAFQPEVGRRCRRVYPRLGEDHPGKGNGRANADDPQQYLPAHPRALFLRTAPLHAVVSYSFDCQ